MISEVPQIWYVGVKNQVTGAQIWRSYSGDNNSWTQVAPATPGTSAATVTGLAVFDGALYAAIQSDAPAQLWCSYGGDWITVMSDGFGDLSTVSLGGMAVFRGYLYAGAGNNLDGALLLRTNDGTTWEQAITPGFGDSHSSVTNGRNAIADFRGQLYVGIVNVFDGGEVWQMLLQPMFLPQLWR